MTTGSAADRARYAEQARNERAAYAEDIRAPRGHRSHKGASAFAKHAGGRSGRVTTSKWSPADAAA